MLQDTTGIVLKSTPFRDTSIVVRIFTHEFGKMSLLAKGIRKSKKGTSGILEPMNKVNFQVNYKEAMDLQILRDLTLVSALTKIRNDFTRLTIGLAMVDMIDKTMQPKDASSILFRLLSRSLEELNSHTSDVQYLYLFYQVQLAKYSGFNPIPHHCMNCGAVLNECALDKTTGSLNCKPCGTPDALFLPSGCCEFLTSLSQTYISNIQDIYIDTDEFKLVKKYLNSFLPLHLHGIEKAKTLQLISQTL